LIKYKKYGKIRIAIRIKGKMRRNVMEHNKDIQAAFMDALNALKEYAKVNGNIVGKEDVAGFFKDMSLDDNKYSMITGYLMANGITIKGEDGTDNEFLHMLESTVRELHWRMNISPQMMMHLQKNRLQTKMVLLLK